VNSRILWSRSFLVAAFLSFLAALCLLAFVFVVGRSSHSGDDSRSELAGLPKRPVGEEVCGGCGYGFYPV